ESHHRGCERAADERNGGAGRLDLEELQATRRGGREDGKRDRRAKLKEGGQANRVGVSMEKLGRRRRITGGWKVPSARADPGRDETRCEEQRMNNCDGDQRGSPMARA